jgi:hypothetical protein
MVNLDPGVGFSVGDHDRFGWLWRVSWAGEPAGDSTAVSIFVAVSRPERRPLDEGMSLFVRSGSVEILLLPSPILKRLRVRIGCCLTDFERVQRVVQLG